MKVYTNKAKQKYWTQKCLVLGCPTSVKVFFHTFFLPCHLPVAICFFFSHCQIFKVTRRKGDAFFIVCIVSDFKKKKEKIKDRQVSKVDMLIRHFHPKNSILKTHEFLPDSKDTRYRHVALTFKFSRHLALSNPCCDQVFWHCFACLSKRPHLITFLECTCYKVRHI